MRGGKKTQEGNVSLHLPREILLFKGAGRPVSTGSRGDPSRCALIYLFDRRRVSIYANPRHFIPLSVELYCPPRRHGVSSINVIDISPLSTRRGANGRPPPALLLQSQPSVASEGGFAREDMTELTAMFCNSVCIPPLQYLPFA